MDERCRQNKPKLKPHRVFRGHERFLLEVKEPKGYALYAVDDGAVELLAVSRSGYTPSLGEEEVKGNLESIGDDLFMARECLCRDFDHREVEEGLRGVWRELAAKGTGFEYGPAHFEALDRYNDVLRQLYWKSGDEEFCRRVNSNIDVIESVINIFNPGESQIEASMAFLEREMLFLRSLRPN